MLSQTWCCEIVGARAVTSCSRTGDPWNSKLAFKVHSSIMCTLSVSPCSYLAPVSAFKHYGHSHCLSLAATIDVNV
jgi:hypothetical protein